MEHARPPGMASVPAHNRACIDCARSKAKCIPNQLGGKCTRCERLNKQCQPALSVRKPRSVKKPTTNSTARLEEKLDGLFSLLKTGTQSGVPPNPDLIARSHTESDAQATARSDAWSDARNTTEFSIAGHQQCAGPVSDFGKSQLGSLASPDTVLPNPGTGPVPETVYNKDVLASHPTSFFQLPSSAPPSSVSTAYSTPNDFNQADPCPTPYEAKDLLKIFEGQMLGNFPFMKMPAYTSPHQFRAAHPFLFICIMAVASRSTAQQTALGTEIRLLLSRKMLMESERSLDLLSGIMVFTGWAQSHIRTHPIVTNLLQLAIGLLGDLGLKKPPSRHPPHLVLSMDARDGPKPFNVPGRTLEERRIALGLFWFSSIISAHFQKIDPLRWTPYLDECLHMLSESQDCSTDRLLFHLVQLQLLAEKALEVSLHDDPVFSRNSVHPPNNFYIKTLLSQLESIMQTIPLALQQNETLLLHARATELIIHEISLSSTPSSSSTPHIERAEALFMCLKAVRSWFDLFCQIPPATYVGLSLSVFTQLARCIITLHRLSTCEAPGWDQGLARDTIDLSVMLKEVSSRLKQVKEAANLDVGISENLDIYNMTAQRLQTIKEWWDAKVTAEAAPIVPSEESRDEMYADFVDDAWLKDTLGMWMEDLQFDPNMQML